MTAKKSAELEPQENEGPNGPAFTPTEDMQQYIEMKKASGVMTSLETEQEQHTFVKEYNTWVKAGRPRPKMPELVPEEDPIPLKLYRTRHLGKQRLYWQDTKGKTHGKEYVDQYTTVITKDARTGEAFEQKIKTGTLTKFTLSFTKIEAEKLVHDAEMRCPRTPAFFFIIGNDTYSVSPEDFTAGDFDEITRKIRARQYTAV